jgi:hypothetical protein
MIGRTVLVTMTFVVFVFATPHVVISPSNSQDDAKPEIAGAELIKGYRNWTRVNPVPNLVPSHNAAACFIPSAADQKLEDESPHRDKYITVYVNDRARRPLMEQEKPKYPQGSIIVKEKLTTAESKSPELLTVMIKRERGYNPAVGDWEFMGLDGTGEIVRARGKLETCQGCHQKYSHVDHVHRGYLPKEVWKKLK